MRVVVVGAGPVGLFSGTALARAGHSVVLVDRDPGPAAGRAGEWERRGVMQFRHPHFFRSIVHEVLAETLPDVWDALLAAGGVPALPPGAPDVTTGLACRRSTFERAMWKVAAREPGLRLATGHADRLTTERGRVSGVVVDGRTVEADVVVVATGRGGRLADDLRAPAEGGPCGFSYVSRMYRARPGVEPPPATTPQGSVYPGHLAILFPQDGRTLSALVVRASTDDALAELRHQSVFEAAVALIPQLAPWTDPSRFDPLTQVMAGGGLTNTYRGQLAEGGHVPLPGVFFVGDAVCTTNPAAGRGVSLGLRQAHTLVGLLRAGDPEEVAQRFDAWCRREIRPWYEDHVLWDSTLLSRFAGADLDIAAPIPSDVICAAAAVDPAIRPALGPYLEMRTTPAGLRAMEDRARAVLRTGWRPAYAAGPSRDELVERILQPAGAA